MNNVERLNELLEKQLAHQKNGEYGEAEECRKEYEKEKNNEDRKFMNKMEYRHKK